VVAWWFCRGLDVVSFFSGCQDAVDGDSDRGCWFLEIGIEYMSHWFCAQVGQGLGSPRCRWDCTNLGVLSGEVVRRVAG
jgi:hypothetical protein